MIVPRIVNPTSDPYNTAYVDTAGVGHDEDGVVAILSGDSVVASGSLLWTGRHILTAAHVAESLSVSNTSVGFNLTTPQYVTASSFTIHESYNGDIGDGFDLAIIELSETAPTDANRYELYTGTDEVGQTFEIGGYGNPGTGDGGDVSDSSFTQRFGFNKFEALGNEVGFGWHEDILIFDFDNGLSANDALGHLIGSNDLGLGSLEVNTAPGDSGGPSFIDGKIAGVTSGGVYVEGTDVDFRTNSSFGEISLNVRVSSFVDWITTAVGESMASETTVNASVYRFYNTTTGTHFYTASETERDEVQQNLSQLTYEGPAFEVASSTNAAAIDIHRLYNTETGSHFYTASDAEIASLTASLPQYVYEGVSYQAYGQQVSGSGALYRFLNTDTGTHFYTASDEERASVEANLAHMTYEGIAYYVDLVG